jgi:hypothetical protein
MAPPSGKDEYPIHRRKKAAGDEASVTDASHALVAAFNGLGRFVDSVSCKLGDL